MCDKVKLKSALRGEGWSLDLYYLVRNNERSVEVKEMGVGGGRAKCSGGGNGYQKDPEAEKRRLSEDGNPCG